MSPQRIPHLDALRGVAIALVILFHAFTRWAAVMPYGATYAEWTIASQGWLGVELFFLLSGYVILMTLERTEGFSAFVFKRWIRLFPAMAMASLLVFTTAVVLTHRPNGTPTWLSLLPGLTFIDSYWWTKLLGTPVEPVETVFWSLFVEFKFYIISALIFYSPLRRLYVPILLLLFLMGMVSWPVPREGAGVILSTVRRVSGLLSLEYFGWFAAGAAIYKSAPEYRGFWWFTGLAITVVCSWQVANGQRDTALFAVLLSIVFAGSFRSDLLKTILANRVLLGIGFVSYPLYLVHENALVSMTITLGRVFPSAPGWLLPVLPVLILMTIAYGIARFGEPMLRRQLATGRSIR